MKTEQEISDHDVIKVEGNRIQERENEPNVEKISHDPTEIKGETIDVEILPSMTDGIPLARELLAVRQY
jgi:hypothetical protein